MKKINELKKTLKQTQVESEFCNWIANRIEKEPDYIYRSRTDEIWEDFIGETDGTSLSSAYLEKILKEYKELDQERVEEEFCEWIANHIENDPNYIKKTLTYNIWKDFAGPEGTSLSYDYFEKILEEHSNKTRKERTI